MNAAHWHLVLVHIPIVLVPTAAMLLSIGLLRTHDILKRISFVFFAICGIVAVAAFLTGGEAEEIVEHLAGISEALIEAHEEAAEVALWLCSLCGIISVILLLSGSRSFTRRLSFIAVIAGWSASAGLAYTGYLGGKIRHPEAHAAAQAQDEIEGDDD